MWMILAFSAGVASSAAQPATNDSTGFTPKATETCLATMAESQDPATCIGASANLCMETTEGGWSTYGMSTCLNHELQYWDARLNAAYKDVQAKRKATDKEMTELESSAPSQSESLLAMQRAWIGFRDAKCDYERSLWGGGTGGGPATVSCHMYITAEQALFLEADAMVE
ncbi:hypothetical protein NBRC116594_24780 [Shimia sp. NS0008-38b]|uniref:lysozyme inhibitor LprI family protein n=1 Tax=Shimia sp. NS0008-38b TaxID=3127653 RepID=UPI00310308A5